MTAISDVTTTTPRLRRFFDACRAARTAFNRIMAGHPVLARDVYSPEQNEADMAAFNARIEREIAKVRAFADAEISATHYPADCAGMLRVVAIQRERYHATFGAADIVDDAERHHAEFRGRVEAQKLIHARNLLAETIPQTVAEAAAVMTFMAEELRDGENADYWGGWADNVARGLEAMGVR